MLLRISVKSCEPGHRLLTWYSVCPMSLPQWPRLDSNPEPPAACHLRPPQQHRHTKGEKSSIYSRRPSHDEVWKGNFWLHYSPEALNITLVHYSYAEYGTLHFHIWEHKYRGTLMSWMSPHHKEHIHVWNGKARDMESANFSPAGWLTGSAPAHLSSTTQTQRERERGRLWGRQELTADQMV